MLKNLGENTKIYHPTKGILVPLLFLVDLINLGYSDTIDGVVTINTTLCVVDLRVVLGSLQFGTRDYRTLF
jgi:hypothetical protein